MQPQKAVFRDSTSQVVPELARQIAERYACVTLTREECLQMFDDDAIQNGLFRLAWIIFERSVRHGGVRGKR